jgi:O-antigen/teichoic acid export membrane protein
LVNIIGNIILLPRIGIVGAAIMTIVSEALQGIFYFYFVRKRITDFRFFSLIWKPVLAALTMGLVIWQIRSMNLFIVVAVGALVYALVLLGLRFFKREDISFIKTLIGKGNI